MDTPVELTPELEETVSKLKAQPTLDFNDHMWIQRGYELIDNCGASCVRQGVKIPSGKMLVGERGDYKIVDEIAARS